MNLKKMVTLSLSAISLIGSAQNVIPKMKIIHEANANPMVLQELHLDIYVLGRTAVTTMDMVFYNPNDRVMEGEFEFPLGDGQQVSRFALDIDGKLREGVVVDKTQGRKAFENIVRRNVDPGLLEKTEGNNFKARVYPMPAKGTRRVLIAFEQELYEKDGKDFYFLPIKGETKVDKFTLKAEIVSRFVEVDTENSLNIPFKNWRNSYISEMSKTDFTLKENIVLLFPKEEKPQVVVASQAEQTYFYGHLMLQNRASNLKTLPKKIVILWDASNSRRKCSIEKEIRLLDSYFSQVKNAEIQLNVFHIHSLPTESFLLKDGNWSSLHSRLEKVIYDGATSLQAMSFPAEADEYLIFTDGIFNFGNEERDFAKLAQNIKKPVYIINSNAIANTDKLKYLAFSTSGILIDLTRQEAEKSATEILHSPYKLIDVKVISGKVSNLFPGTNTIVSDANFTLSGELLSESAELELSFGYDNQTSRKQTLVIKKETENDEKKFALLRRVWAEKKIAQWQSKGKPQAEIDAIGKAFGIVTAGTSLIVLERLEDYVQYKIVPPTEWKELYFSILKKQDADEKEAKKQKEKEKEQIIKEVIELSEKQTKWWKTKFPVISKATHSKRVASFSREEEIVPSPPVEYMAEEASVLGVATDERAFSSDLQKDEVFEKNVPQTSSIQIQLNEWSPETPYLKVLEYTDAEKSYETYQKMKDEYGEMPAFYVDAADYFFKKGKKDAALLIISNLAELNLEEAQVLRILGQKLTQYGFSGEAVFIYRKVLKIREEEPQSYRDLGLALAQNNLFDEAIKMLYEVVSNSWDGRFTGIQLIAMNEINSIANTHKGVDISFVNPKLIKNEPVDIRVILTWDTDNSDMDLWVTDPKKEKCYYKNRLTYLGGKISDDITGGYGPEEFMLKKAVKGNYVIEVNYYGTRSQKQLFPVSLRIEFFTDFGKPSQQKKETVVRLTDQKEIINVGEFLFK